MQTTETDLMTAGEAARALGVGADWIRRLVYQGRLRALRTRSGRILIPAAAAETYARRRGGRIADEVVGQRMRGSRP